ncbi:MAG: carbonic anhydrase [Pseudomonadota bacterium]
MPSYSNLPQTLIDRHHDWHKNEFQSQQDLYSQLVDEGQHPQSMIISCCDSRVNVTSIFEAEAGDFFVHRNIANLVPPYAPGTNNHGTSAALEYAVCVLEVQHIIVVGHSQCGGVKGCHDMCSGHAPSLEQRNSFVGHWLEVLRPAYEKVVSMKSSTPIEDLEREGIRLSIENLMTFPFVAEKRNAKVLALHGLWHDIKTGRLEMLNPATEGFEIV